MSVFFKNYSRHIREQLEHSEHRLDVSNFVWSSVVGFSEMHPFPEKAIITSYKVLTRFAGKVIVVITFRTSWFNIKI